MVKGSSERARLQPSPERRLLPLGLRQRNARGEVCPLIGNTFQREGAPQTHNPLAHRVQAQMSRKAACWVEANTIIADIQH